MGTEPNRSYESLDRRPLSGTGIGMLILGIILIASNLRAPLTAIGPIIPDIRLGTGISNTWAGMLTTLPLITFALLSPLAPRMARRFGMERTILVCLLVLTGGIALRSLPSISLLFAGTILVGLAIAVCNVLIPSMVKREFPERVGVMTGIYSLSMNLWAAVASGVSIPLMHRLGLGWRGSLVFWALLSLLALAVWLPQLRGRTNRSVHSTLIPAGRELWRSPLAWKVTLFMGVQSLLFYVNISWLPEILHEHGLSQEASGWMLSLMQFISLPATFLIPVIAGRKESQRGMVLLLTSLLVVGYSGLLFGYPVLMPLWVILIGIASGASFSLAVMFFTLRTHSAEQSADLSGMAQAVGYLLAACGPTLLGFIHDLTAGWTVPLLLLILCSLFYLLVGLGAGSKGYVTSAEEQAWGLKKATLS